MPYITREDGEHFVIPSYREIIFAKQKAALKKEVISLSQNYGDHITINRKGPNQYEVAFSPDIGYSLGETVWHHFGRPNDMIYCEAIPDTTEAILVIVKDGSVYLDGSFPVDSIPEELVIFLTQQNNFDIYVYGNVPISQKPEDGKFSFEESSVHSFTILEDPVFNTLPLLKAYYFQLVEPALKAQGIGAFPVLPFALIVGGVIVAWMAISFVTTEKKPEKVVTVMEKNPYEKYVKDLESPDPVQVLKEITNSIALANSIDGWSIFEVQYSGGLLNISMRSAGNSIENLMAWAEQNGAKVQITSKSVNLQMLLVLPKRPLTKKLYPLNEIMAILIDRIYKVNPNKKVSLKGSTGAGRGKTKQKHKTMDISVNVGAAAPVTLNLIADQFQGLPLVFKTVKLRAAKESFDGTIIVTLLGS